MISDRNKIILFPVLALPISQRQKDYILRKFDGITLTDIDNYVENQASEDEIREYCELCETEEERQELFDQAKVICEVKYIAYSQLERLATLGAMLEIDDTRTGFDFSLYEKAQREEYEAQRLLIHFAIMSSAIEFVPLNGWVSCFATSSLQTVMVTKMAKLYDFQLDVKQFLRMAGGTTGIGLLFKVIGWGLSRLFPLKWMWRSSAIFVSTYAVGIAAKTYIAAKGVIDADNLGGIMESAVEEGRMVFQQFRDYIRRNRKCLAKELKDVVSSCEKKKS